MNFQPHPQSVALPYVVPLFGAVAPQPGRAVWFEIIAERSVNAPVSIGEVAVAVARHYSLEVACLRSRRRFGDYVTARHLAMYLARELSKRSYAVIAREFVCYSHQTVMHAERKIRRLLARDAHFAAQVASVRARILADAGRLP